MKKNNIIPCLIGLVLLTASPLFAGGIDNRSNFSGEYVRTVNRNAATDSLDAVVYNPAGVMTMENGNHANLSIHYVSKDYANTIDGVRFEQDTPSQIPALFGLFKRDKWAGFLAFTIPAGGGEVEYNSGNATTRIGATGLANMINAGAGAVVYGPIDGEKLKAESYYYAITAGGAYKINDILSLSLAGRYIIANKKINATFQVLPTALGTAVGAPARTAVLDYEDEAKGLGAIVGLNLNYEPFLFTLKYETETRLKFKYDVKADTVTGLPAGLGATMGVINAREHSRNLPAVLALGAAYRINTAWRMDINYTYYFHENANWGGAENNVDNGWETGIAVEYLLNPDLKLSIGYLYTSTGMDARYALKEAPELDANTIGAGFVYKWNENLKIDCGIGLADYKTDTYTDVSSGTPMVIGLEKDVLMLSAGVEYRF